MQQTTQFFKDCESFKQDRKKIYERHSDKNASKSRKHLSDNVFKKAFILYKYWLNET